MPSMMDYPLGNYDGAMLVTFLILAIAGGVLAYFFFMKKKSSDFKGKWKKVHEFLNFDSLVLSWLIPVLFVIAIIFDILLAFTNLFKGSIGMFFIYFIVLPIVSRLILEQIYILLKISKDVQTIRDNNKKK